MYGKVENQEQLLQSLKNKEEQIEDLNKLLKESEHKSKVMQMKLLNNAKKLNIQLQ